MIAGTGMPGASAVSKADWIQVSAVRDTEALAAAITKTGLGAGEASAVFLANELAVEPVLMDEWRGRPFAKEHGLTVIGCVGILEELYWRGTLADLRQAYESLLNENIRIDLPTLQRSLKQFKLPPL